MSASPAIEVVGLGRAYRLPLRGPRGAPTPASLFWALSDVNLRVERGEAVALVGRNGAGKSTLLSVLARIVPPTRGRVLLRGRVVGLLEVGTGFHPELTGRENAILNAVLHGLSRAQARARLPAIMEFAEVGAHVDLPLKHWSSGLALRLAFAVAVHLEPDVLLLDEVLGVGDAGFTARCLDHLGGLTRRGTSLVCAGHDLALLRRLCTQAAWLAGGRVNAKGPAPEVLSAYERS